ncbi:MAG TPA: hypothetical protein PKC73_12430 [Dermatophilaceae bacterium]|nr:hypothetical protein [Actinomycetales bacterium]HMT32889.1 hypothetical protein [Dermatophilaceae bacterium]HMT90430.1 hypothetical protein [Dermatophilaceae bacterium]
MAARRALVVRSSGSLVMAVLIGLGGCSSSGGSPSQSVEAFYRALGRKDVAAACEVVSYGGKPLAGDDITLCRSGFQAIGELATPADLSALASVSAPDIPTNGDHAGVLADQLTGVPTAYRQNLTLVRIDGRWYIDSPM